MEDKNIFKRLSQITSEITAVAKNLNVGWGKSSYKAVGEADVLAAVKPIESKNGVYSYPYSREIIERCSRFRKGRRNREQAAVPPAEDGLPVRQR